MTPQRKTTQQSTNTPDRSSQEYQEFLDGYIDAVLFTGIIYNDETEDFDYLDDSSILSSVVVLGKLQNDLAHHPRTREETYDFFSENYDVLNDLINKHSITWAYHGHDFLLTRDGHGAGFWDRGYGDTGQELTDACQGYGNAFESGFWWSEPDNNGNCWIMFD